MIPNSLKEEMEAIRKFLNAADVGVVNNKIADKNATVKVLEELLPVELLSFFLNFYGGRTDVIDDLDGDAQAEVRKLKAEIDSAFPALESNAALKQRASQIKVVRDMFQDLRTPDPTEHAFNQFDGVVALPAWQAKEGELRAASRLLFVRNRKVLFDTTLDIPGFLALAKAVLEIAASEIDEVQRFGKAGVTVKMLGDSESEIASELTEIRSHLAKIEAANKRTA